MNRNLWIIAVGLVAAVACDGASLSKETEELLDYKCKDNSHYTTYNPSDCNKYIECDNGKAQHKSCGWFYRFDEKSNSCTFQFWMFGSADCSKVIPPSPSPTTSPATQGPSTSTPSNGGSSTTPKAKNSAVVSGLYLPLGLLVMAALALLS